MVSKVHPRPTPRTRSKPSPLKSIAVSLRSCRRHLLKLFNCFTLLSTPTRRKHGFRRLHPSSIPPPLPLLPPSTKKTLFLDLDETLIHSNPSSVPPLRYDFIVHPYIDGQILTFYVLKRPGVDVMLKKLSKHFEIVVFTAGLESYASLVLDRLDPEGELFAHRLYRGACREVDGRLVKDLAVVGRELGKVVIVDDNPHSYILQPENAVPVRPFTDDARDGEMERVVEVLEKVAGFEDLRDGVKKFCLCLGGGGTGSETDESVETAAFLASESCMSSASDLGLEGKGSHAFN